MKALPKRLLASATLTCAAISLSGCIVAIPVMMAATAATVAVAGFAVYKTVQTSSGGTVRIEFGSKDSKKADGPAILTVPSNTLYVLGAGAREHTFVATVQAAGKFRGVTGGTDSQDLSKMDDAQIASALEAACKGRRVDLVVAAVDQGQSVQSNMLSLKRGNSTQKLGLDAYSCSTHKLAWSEPMAVVIESGSKAMAQSEIDTVAGQAWAERLLAAKV